jgi:hypothetical protein
MGGGTQETSSGVDRALSHVGVLVTTRFFSFFILIVAPSRLAAITYSFPTQARVYLPIISDPNFPQKVAVLLTYEVHNITTEHCAQTWMGFFFHTLMMCTW